MTRSLPTFAFLAVVAGAAIAADPTKSTGDWPQWRGPNRDDVSKEKGLLREWPKEGPKLLWTFRDAGVGYSGFAVVRDRLYSMGADDKQEYVFAVDLKTRKKVWSTEVGTRFVNGWGDGPRGTPTVDDGLVYVIGGQGHFLCVQADSGEKVWMKRLKQDLDGAQMSGWGYTESPLVDGDQVVATPGGSKGAVAALNKKTGEVLWQSKQFTDKAAYSSLVIGEIGGTRQYVQMTGESVAAVSAKDGALLWRFERRSPTAAIPTPIVSDDNVYATSGYGTGCTLLKIERSDNGLKAVQGYANKDMTVQHGGAIKIGDHVYGYSDSKGWVCMEFKTGKVMWTDKSLGKGSCTCADGHLYCYAESDGTMALVEANPAGWKEKGRFKIPEKTSLPRKSGKIWTHPVVANGKLYLRDLDLIFCFDVSDGKSS
jgi:outer membrane protein assembly factor BamB